MVTPKTISGKVRAGAIFSFREVLGQSPIQAATAYKAGALTAQRPSLEILHPKGVSISRHNVSVGKTWGTDLVAAARRDAKFVPFRLLTAGSSSSESAFVAIESLHTTLTSRSERNNEDKLSAAGRNRISITNFEATLQSFLDDIDAATTLDDVVGIVARMERVYGPLAWKNRGMELLKGVVKKRPHLLPQLVFGVALVSTGQNSNPQNEDVSNNYLNLVGRFLKQLPVNKMNIEDSNK